MIKSGRIKSEADPNFPITRGGWRGVERSSNGSSDDWKRSLTTVAMKISIEFSEQLAWRFDNLEKFRWMDLIHPSKFATSRKASSNETRELLGELKDLYPFAVTDIISLEHNLDVLHNNQEISILLGKLINERDQVVEKRKRKTANQRKTNETDSRESGEEQGEEQQAINIEQSDQFEIASAAWLEEETVKKGTPSMQDLLTVIHNVGLGDALPQAIIPLEIAAVTPLTSVHCERVFSRMKRVVSSSRSCMLQTRKEHLVFLQVEHSLLRWLRKQPGFYDNIVSRFKGQNQKRFERFSRK